MMRAAFSMRAARLGFTSLLFLALASGCGGGGGGARVSGKVTFKGQPVPAGRVYIKPDVSKGNNGTTGYATINNGVYDTAAPGGHGAPTGAVILEVEGMNLSPPPGAGPDVGATLLFTGYTKAVELSGSSSAQDIDVPESAAGGPEAPKTPTVVIP